MKRTVLSVDGGGIRGAAAAVFLEKLESSLNGRSLYDTFDLFAGTSTGGIIACALGVLGMDGKTLANVYNYENGNRIMNQSWWDRAAGLKQAAPKYDGVGKRAVLAHYFGDKMLTDAKKPILVITYDVEARKSAVLKSSSEEPISALDATDATSAAPLYFPTVQLGDRWLIDGGVVANNPAMCAYAEAKKLWPNDEIRLLSVGTGCRTRPIPGKDSQGYGFVGWITHDLLGVVMDETVVEYQTAHVLGANYLRVTSPLLDVNDDLDDCSRGNLAALERMGVHWFEEFGARAKELVS